MRPPGPGIFGSASGVRPSPGAAATERAGAPEYLTAALAGDVAAPEDGGTPVSPQSVGRCRDTPAGPLDPSISDDL